MGLQCEQRSVISSFLSANNDFQAFGTFRIPKSFYDQFGSVIPTRIRIKCQMFEWKAKYDRDLKIFYGLRRFMKYYEIKMYGVVQFDFYGENEFGVRIFKNSAIETYYRKMSPVTFLKSKKSENWKKDEYVVDCISLQYQKIVALWSFNAFRNYVAYFELKIESVHIDGSLPYLRLSSEFENLYNDWENGAKVYLRLTEDTWEIDVRRMENCCVLGKQWYGFAKKIKLKVGDTLVLFRLSSSGTYVVNVCIFKGKEQRIDDGREKKGAFERSFVKVVTQHCLDEAVLFVPKTIKDKYGEKLASINELEICGQRCSVLYNSTGAYLANLETMIEKYNLRKKETVVFTINDSNVLFARIYQMDGKEIDYGNRSVESSDNGKANWFWDVIWTSESDGETDTSTEEGCGEKLKVYDNMKRQNFFNGRYPLFVVVAERETLNCDEVRLPERFLMECSDRIPDNVRLRLPNGREIHVHFRKKEKCLTSMSEFIKECRRIFGTTMIFSYEGSGNFLVYVFKEDCCEADYFTFKTIPRATVYDQDKINGVGWKFTQNANGPAIELGEIAIPRRFWRMFGNKILRNVSFHLSNGSMFNGQYLHEGRKITGLLSMVGLKFYEENDLLLFTYCGNGKFDVIIFDNEKVEKIHYVNEIDKVVNEEDDKSYGAADEENKSATLIDDVEMNEAEMGNYNADVIVDDEMNEPAVSFSAVLTKCNVNSTSHGVYIPGYVTPKNRNWISGEHVTFRSEDTNWEIGVVYSKGLARFSAGWNKFARDKRVKLGETLVFILLEGEGGLTFHIDIPGRS